jgi:hypothetical protein
MSTQFHILVVGFELEKRGRDISREGDLRKTVTESRKTELRHYRYDISTHTLSNENNAVVIRNGKQYVAQFPVANTMVLVEEVEK